MSHTGNIGLQKPYNSSIEQLKKQIRDDSNPFKETLEYCLKVAKYRAQAELESNLYASFNNIYMGNAWPIKAENYIHFLEVFFRNAFQAQHNQSIFFQKTEDYKTIYNKLYHFHWLINQPVKIGTYTLNSLQDYNFLGFNFAYWMDSYIEEWRYFLGNNSEISFAYKTFQFFIEIKAYSIENTSKYISNWVSFKDFISDRMVYTKL